MKKIFPILLIAITTGCSQINTPKTVQLQQPTDRSINDSNDLDRPSILSLENSS